MSLNRWNINFLQLMRFLLILRLQLCLWYGSQHGLSIDHTHQTQELLIIIMMFGFFEYFVLPMGIKPATNIFKLRIICIFSEWSRINWTHTFMTFRWQGAKLQLAQNSSSNVEATIGSGNASQLSQEWNLWNESKTLGIPIETDWIPTHLKPNQSNPQNPTTS